MGRNRFDQLSRQIKHIRKEVNQLSISNVIKENMTRIAELEKKVEKLSDQEETHWKQRSRVNWLKEGDRTTRFFHASASSRRRTNFIKGLLDDNGIWHTETQSLVDITKHYFGNLFYFSYPSAESIGAVPEVTDSVVDNQMNEALCAPFSEKEIHRAVFQMHSSKSWGTDGFTTFLYQKLLPVIGNDITAGVLAILNDQQDPSDWNATLITLILKVKEPLNLEDFRPH